MRWEKPPLWPVAIPSAMGFVLACSPLRTYKIDALSFISTAEGQESLIAPLIGLTVLTLLLRMAPEEIGNRNEMIAGAVLALFFGVLPQALFFPWMIIVILAWISQSIYVWKKDFPSFRIGLWLGLGGASGLFMGGFFSHYFL